MEGVEIDAKNHKVTVKGENADPNKVRERLREKSGRHVELISPKPHTNQQHKKQENPQVITIYIYIYILYRVSSGIVD